MSVRRFLALGVVRIIAVGLCVVAASASASAWIAASPTGECHECCPDGIRPAPASAENCCVVAPTAPTTPVATPAPVVVAVVIVPLVPVAAWSAEIIGAADMRTADPPARSIPVLLRTSVLLI
jgi:hypothetical protein